MKSLSDHNGKIRVVFATVALGVGVNLADVNTVIHYGVPRSLKDYFEESGCGGRTGEQAFSTIYWCPKDAPQYKNITDHRKQKCVLVRDNSSVCRRKWLIGYFIEDFSVDSMTTQSMCCDVCTNKANIH